MTVVEHQKIMQKEIQHDRVEIKRPQGFDNPCCVCDCTILIGYCECGTLQNIMIAQHFWARTSLGSTIVCLPASQIWFCMQIILSHSLKQLRGSWREMMTLIWVPECFIGKSYRNPNTIWHETWFRSGTCWNKKNPAISYTDGSRPTYPQYGTMDYRYFFIHIHVYLLLGKMKGPMLRPQGVPCLRLDKYRYMQHPSNRIQEKHMKLDKSPIRNDLNIEMQGYFPVI